MREATRAIIRIITNYLRLGLNLALGLVFVPFVFRWIGAEAQGLIAFLGAGVGIAAMFREITSRSVIRELGAAYHEKGRARFPLVLNSTLKVSVWMGLLACAVFVVLYFAVPWLNIPNHLDHAARVLILSQLVYIFVTTAASPIFNMMIVKERFVAYNTWVLVERATVLAGALITHYILGVDDPARAIMVWSPLVAALQVSAFLIPVLVLLARDPELRPHRGHTTPESVRSVMGTFGWYLVVELSSNLHERVGMFVMNAFFGLYSNTIFGVAYQFVSYVRQATQGVTFGIDAVSARLSTESSKKPLLALMHHSTRLHGLVAVPAGALVFILADPLVRLWLEGHIEPGKGYLKGIITTVQIMAVPLTARAIADGWIFILYGAGYIRRYAPLIFFGALCNPVISVILHKALGASIQRPETLFITPAVFAVVYTTVHFFLLPVVGARCLGMAYTDFFRPLWRPFMATVLASVVPIFLPRELASLGLSSRFLTLLITGVCFATLYAALASWLVLTGPERDRFLWSPLRRIARRGT